MQLQETIFSQEFVRLQLHDLVRLEFKNVMMPKMVTFFWGRSELHNLLLPSHLKNARIVCFLAYWKLQLLQTSLCPSSKDTCLQENAMS